MSALPRTTWKSVSLTLLLVPLGLLVAVPLAMLADGPAPWAAVRDLLSDDSIRHALWRTLAIAALSTALATLLALPAALLARRCRPALHNTLWILGLLPLAMPPFLMAAVIAQLAHALGAAPLPGLPAWLQPQPNSLLLVIAYALHFLPLILFSLVSGLGRIERGQLESARNLGAGWLTVWGRIGVPLALPAFGLGVALVMLRVIDDVAAPLVLGVPEMLAPQILLALAAEGPHGRAGSIAILLLALSALLLALIASNLSHWQVPWRHGGAAPRSHSRSGGLLQAIWLLPMAGLALLPPAWLLLSVLFGDADSGLSQPATPAAALAWIVADHQPALLRSLLFGLGVGLVVLLVSGLSAALGAGRGASGRITRTAMIALLAVPGSVLALGYLRLGDRLADMPDPSAQLIRPELIGPELAWLALVAVVTIKTLPFGHALLVPRLRLLGGGVAESARVLGSGDFGLLLRLRLPALATGLAGIVMAGCVAAMLEVSAVVLLIAPERQPLAGQAFHALAGAQAGAAGQGLLLVASLAMLLLLAVALLRQSPQLTAADSRRL